MLTCCSSSSSSSPTPIITTTKHHSPKHQPPPSKSLPYSLTTKSNILLSTYLKTKPFSQSLKLFHLLPSKDTITYNTLISYTSNHPQHFSISLHLFLQLINSTQLQPDVLTFRAILKLCIETNEYEFGRQVHAYIVKFYGRCNVDLVMSTYLINMYSGVGMVESAGKVFDEIPVRELDVVAVGSMMGCCNKSGDYNGALGIFKILMGSDAGVVRPNEFVFTLGLSACAGLRCLYSGKQVHACIVKASLGGDVFIGTALSNMYVKCEEVGCAKKSFLEIRKPNVVAWNAIMAGGFDGIEVLKLFEKMWSEKESGVLPDHVTFATVLRACKDVDLFSVIQIHGLVVKMIGVEVDVFIGGALFNIYVDNSCVSDAEKVFDSICGIDICAVNLAIQGYRRNIYRKEAVRLFYKALQMDIEINEDTITSLMMGIGDLNEGKQLHTLATKMGFSGNSDSDVPIGTSLIMMYTEFLCFDDAVRLFDQILFPDLVLWTSMISSLSLNGRNQEALKLYVQMLCRGLSQPPNHYTFSSILASCASLSAVEEGKQIHAQILKSCPIITSDIFVASSLVDMYAKSGYIKEAKNIFDEIPIRDVAAWNSMITGLAQHGYAENAIEVFQELLGSPDMEPNHISFIGVLSACSHRGLVDEGYRFFKLIKAPTVDHYTCLIDLLGRAGHLEDALNLIEEMPFDPDEVIWSSLLASSRIHQNIIIGEYSANKLFQLNPKDPGTYVALSNIYAAAGRWEDVNRIRQLMNNRGVRKNPGCSWLRVNGEVHVFVAEDVQHTQKK
ncbi:hypothetical protein ACHQM5_019180 [Ranunculus cassubicifolius]